MDVKKKGNYRKLKGNKGTVVIKAQEVLLPIFARGRLSKREAQVVWAIIADSWRWRNAQFTEHQVTLGSLSRDTGLDKGTVSKVVAGLTAKNIIEFNKDRRASFNEHYERWKVDKTPTPKRCTKKELTNSGVDKTPTLGVGKTPKGTPLNIKGANELRNPKNNKDKNIRTIITPAAERRINYEFDAAERAIQEKFGREGNPAKIQLALNECEDADLHPLDLISKAGVNWLGYVRTACRSPDDYRDRIRSYDAFVEEVIPISPETEHIMEEVMARV